MSPIQIITTLLNKTNNTYFVAAPHLYNITCVEAISVPFLSVTFNRTVSVKQKTKDRSTRSAQKTGTQP